MISLHKGTTLIEASAGTGKTYTLVRIALRLTIENNVPLNRILAVTFTEAATEELASRIRELYQDCLQQLELDKVVEPTLIEALDASEIDHATAIRRLKFSLEVFDEAPISTIHGFCKRSLDQVALETKAPLDAQLENIENTLVDQLQNEYLRQHIHERSEVLSLFYPQRKSSFCKRLTALARESASHPYAQLEPEPRDYPLDSLDETYRELIDAIARLMQDGEAIAKKLKGGRKITKLISGATPTLLKAIERGNLLPDDIDSFVDLSVETWEKTIKKNFQDEAPPPALERIAHFLSEVEIAFQSLLLGYKNWLSENLKEAKERLNIISYNDLIHRLDSALRNDQSGRVASQLSERYDAALIDEFQDTDPTQYDIAQTLFGQGQHYLFFIGDPKQAIYRFRGADIFAYFKAINAPGLQKIDLGANYRSHPKLVHATNSLFENSEEGFLYDSIAFKAVTPAQEDIAPNFHLHAPFYIRAFNDIFGALGSKTALKTALSRVAANDFAHRLNQDPELDAKKVAFLVNNRHEANSLSQELERRGIASIIRADRSIFETGEIGTLRQLLEFLSAPTRVSLKRGLLLTPICGYTTADLLNESFEEEAAPVFDHLSHWAQNWFETNFDNALNRLISLSNASQTLLRSTDGERRYTNLRHLSELLEEAREQSALSPRGLLNWLERHRQSDASSEDDWQTRLSSDEGKPQIITLHKSKGLEFPIVILPFLSLLNVDPKSEYSIYHDTRTSDSKLVLDLSRERSEEARAMAYREELAEKIRLIYVALTRAVYQNVLYLAPESNDGTLVASAFAQMMIGCESAAPGTTLTSDEITQRFFSKLETLAASHSEHFKVDYIDLQSNATFIACQDRDPPSVQTSSPRHFKRLRLPGPDRILSFSSLSRQLNAHSIKLEEDHLREDEPSAEGEILEEEPSETPPRQSIFTLLKGAQAGDLFHLILERFDFCRGKRLREVVAEAFKELQFPEPEYESIVHDQIFHVSQTALQTNHGNFRLADIPPAARIAELEFAYPVHGDARSHLQKAFSQAPLGKIPSKWLQRFEHQSHPITASMLRGFIDLVFEHEGRLYILDWKSNHLGDSLKHYTEKKMVESMADHDYFLQYILYCVALKRFIENRFPGDAFADRFGGVFYLFVRGIQNGTQSGIYYDQPAPELIEAVDAALSTQ